MYFILYEKQTQMYTISYLVINIIFEIRSKHLHVHTRSIWKRKESDYKRLYSKRTVHKRERCKRQESNTNTTNAVQ